MASHEYRPDVLGFGVGECFLKRVYSLLLWAHRARWLRGWDLGRILREADAWLGRFGWRRRGYGCRCLVIVVEIQLTCCGGRFVTGAGAQVVGLEQLVSTRAVEHRGVCGAVAYLLARRFLGHAGRCIVLKIILEYLYKVEKVL